MEADRSVFIPTLTSSKPPSTSVSGKEALASARSYYVEILNDYTCIFIWRMPRGEMVFVLGKKV